MSRFDEPVVPPLEQLRRGRDLDEATADLDDLPPPLELTPGQEMPSSVLARLRSDER